MRAAQLGLRLDLKPHKPRAERVTTGAGVHPRLTVQTYRPIDELLEIPVVRILRAIRWFDWARFDDVWPALGLVDDIKTRGSYAWRITELARLGLLDARSMTLGGRTATEYRINDKGRLELELILRRADLSRLDARRGF